MEMLLFNGVSLLWYGKSTFKASSGMPGYQYPRHQCLVEKGPVPEGRYYIPLIEGGDAQDDGNGICQLKPSWQIQTIPRGKKAGSCEPYWANWGHNRVRFEPSDKTTKAACSPARSGFYLHDSSKGYSHGCIEVETRFFSLLRPFVKKNKDRKLFLTIKYTAGLKTYGGT